MDDPRARPDEQPPMADETLVRRGHAEDLEPARRTGAFLLVADSAGEVVGMALVTPASSRPAEVAVVQVVFVTPERWGEGTPTRIPASTTSPSR